MKNSTMKLALAAVAAAAVAGAGAQSLRELTFQTAMPAKAAPVVDGVLDDACWKDATVHSDYYEYLKPNPRRVTNTKTDCMIVYDAKGVYTGIRNWEDAPEKLRQNCKKNNQNDIWLDDSGEIYYDPDAAGIGFYKFIVNSLGKVDTAWRMDGANMHEDWTCGGLVCAAKVFDDRWEVELFIPWSAFHNRPAPKPGDIWTFNHSRFRFAKYGWGPGFSTSAPGGSGVSANKFGYLYFSDGSKPDAKKVLDILEKRLACEWGISINETVYLHDVKGTRETDLIARKAVLEKEFRALEADLEPRVAAEKNNALSNDFKKYRTSFTNELATFDGSFAAVKVFGELVDGLRDVDCRIAIGELASTNAAVAAKAKPLALELAGQYDLTPPKEFNGHNGWYRHNFVRGAYPTAHLEWQPGAGDGKGPLTLFMPPFGGGARTWIEYAERFACEDLYFPGNFGATGIYEDPLSHGTYLDKRRQFETLLAKNPELVVVCGIDMRNSPSKYRHELLRRVRDDGVGLVLTSSYGFQDLLRKLKDDPAERRALAARAPIAEMPGYAYTGRRQPGKSDTECRMTLYRFGRGRIAVLDLGRAPGWSLEWRGAFETAMAFYYNVFQWARGEKPSADVVFQTDSGREKFGAVSNFIAFDARTAAGGADRVKARIRDVDNQILGEREWPLREGSNLLSVDTSKLAGGDYVLDVIATKGGRVGAVSVKPFTKESPLGKLVLDGTNDTVVAEGQMKRLRTAWPVQLAEKADFRFELYTMPYRELVQTNRFPLVNRAVFAEVTIPRGEFPTLAALAKVSVVTPDGRVLGAAEKMVYFPNHRFEDYTLISWGGVYEAYPEFFGPKLVDEFGYRNHLGATGNGPANFDCRAVPYAAHVSLGGGKDGTSWRTYGHTIGVAREDRAEWEQEKKALGEDWNVYRPEVQAHLEKWFSKKVKKTAPYGVSVWSLGDECGFSTDIGFGPNGQQYFAAFLEKKYGTIARFNAVHGTKYACFMEVEHKHCVDAVRQGDWTSWFDQVQYAERTYSDFYQFLSKVIKKQDPRGRVGAEGSSAGDLELTVDKLEFWGPYRSLVADELLRNIAPDRVRGTWWGGYLRSTRNGFPERQWEYVLTGTVNADEWFAVSPGSTEGSHAGDLMPAPYVQAMLPHLKPLRRGIAQTLIRTPFRRDGFAFWFSHPSGQAAGLDDRFTPPADSLGDLIRFCYRKGYNVEMITSKTAKKLAGNKVLFLAGATVLSDADAKQIADFAKNGGIVVADVVPALLNEYMGVRKANPLAELFGDVTFEKASAPEASARDFRREIEFNGRKASLAMKGGALKTCVNADGLVWKPVGRGGALLLNFTIASALVSTDEDAVDALIEPILALQGIAPKETLEGLPADGKVFRVRELEYAKGRKLTLAGFKIYMKALGGRVTLDFGKEGYVYEVDRGFVGKSAKVEVGKLEIPFKLYSQFPEEQLPPVVALRAGKAEVAGPVEKGTVLSFDAAALRQGSVYRFELKGPDGGAIAAQERVFCAEAKKTPKFSFRMAYNYMPGTYAAVLKDIATGLVTEVKIELK